MSVKFLESTYLERIYKRKLSINFPEHVSLTPCQTFSSTEWIKTAHGLVKVVKSMPITSFYKNLK